jgi:hypothetical protein
VKTNKRYSKKSSAKLPLGLIVAGVLLAGIIIGVLYTQNQEQDTRSRAAEVACQPNIYGECTGVSTDKSLAAVKILSTIPKCEKPVALKITYSTNTTNGCMAGRNCEGYQTITSVGWNTSAKQPLANYNSGLSIPLTTADGTWIADNRNYRSSPLIHGLALSRVGDGRIVISHANSMTDQSDYHGQFQAVNATMNLNGAVLSNFINGDQGWALDPSTITVNGVKKVISYMVDGQGDKRWSVAPYTTDQNGVKIGGACGFDEITYALGAATWQHKTRICHPGDDYVMKLSCPPAPKAIDIMLVADRSSTMNTKEPNGKTKLANELEAMHNFAVTMNSSTAYIGVDSFGAQGDRNDSTYGNLTLASEYNSTLNSGLTNNYDSLLSVIDGIKYIKSGTCIQCGILMGNRQLTDTNARRVVILLSDGMANHTWTGTTAHINGVTNTQAAINAANAGRAAGIEYKVIGYGSEPNNVDQETLRQIAGCSPDLSSACANYQYEPNAINWNDAFQNVAQDLLQGK